jgi:hypothetical protein
MRIRSPCVVSTYRWSVVTDVMYARSSEKINSRMEQTEIMETAAPEPVLSLKSSSIFG